MRVPRSGQRRPRPPGLLVFGPQRTRLDPDAGPQACVVSRAALRARPAGRRARTGRRMFKSRRSRALSGPARVAHRACRAGVPARPLSARRDRRL